MNHDRSSLRDAPGGEAQLSPPDVEARLRLATRVAWMYFVEGLKQEDVAAALGLNRMRVNRLLAAAREEGLVRIEIDSAHGAAADCEMRLRRAFGLSEALVVPTPVDRERVVDSVGRGLGMLLSRRLVDGMTIGIHHGRSIHALFSGLRQAALPNSAIVALNGSLSPIGRMVPYETVAQMALTLQAACYHLAAPTYARSIAERDQFLGLPIVDAVLERARSCDIAIMSVSRVSDDGGLVGNGYVTPQEAQSIREAGAVGAVLGVFIDAMGRTLDHDINRRRIGLDLEGLSAIPEVILTGAGAAKVGPLHAALLSRLAHTLVIDEETAWAVLQREDRRHDP